MISFIILMIRKLTAYIGLAAIMAAGVIQPADAEEKKKKPEEPKVVDPGTRKKAPSDAIVLFDGSSLDNFKSRNGNKAPWKLVEGNAVEVTRGDGGIFSKEEFGSFQLHVEWATPTDIKGNGQGRGNSGVYLHGRYEVQVLDSYENSTYPDGQAGAVYGIAPPLVNATRAPGKWQTYDIIFNAPKKDAEGNVIPATVTVLHNGILIQNNLTVPRATTASPLRGYAEKGPIYLQDHSNPVRYRNIWVRPLD